jgi:hypothetical protein
MFRYSEEFMCSDDLIVQLNWLIGAPHSQFPHELSEIKPIALFLPNLFDRPQDPLITSLSTIAYEVGYRYK